MDEIEVRAIEPDEYPYWDSEIRHFSSTHPMDSSAWATVRMIDNWKPLILVAESNGRLRGGILLLIKHIVCTPFCIAMSPKGPVWHLDDDATLQALITGAKRTLKQKHCIFFRINPNLPIDYKYRLNNLFQPMGGRLLDNRWSFWNPSLDDLGIDLSAFQTPDDYLLAMKGKVRREIKRVLKSDLHIKKGNRHDDVKAFHGLFRSFSIHRGFMSRDSRYQQTLWEQFVQKGNGCLALIHLKEKIVGGCIFISYAGKAQAMHLADVPQYRSYNVQSACYWETVRWCIEAGVHWLSFGGSATPGQEKFKRKLLAQKNYLAGYWDFPLIPLLYALVKFGEFKVLPMAYKLLTTLYKKLKSVVSPGPSKER